METTAEELGKLVRQTWLDWAKTQADPQPEWLIPWNELPEHYREVNRQIGQAIVQQLHQSIEEAFAHHGIPVDQQESTYKMVNGAIQALLKVEGDRIIGVAREHEQKLYSYGIGQPAERVRCVLQEYDRRTQDAEQLNTRLRTDVWVYLRSISLMVASAASAGTHREKDATLRAIIRLLETSINKVRDVLRLGNRWDNPDLFSSEYPVQDYIDTIHKLKEEIRQLKTAANQNQFDDLTI